MRHLSEAATLFETARKRTLQPTQKLSNARSQALKLRKSWAQLSPLKLNENKLIKQKIFVKSYHPQTNHFDEIRTRIIGDIELSDSKRLVIAPISPDPSNTVFFANLLTSFARLRDFRVAVFDFNLRAPELSKALELYKTGPKYSALVHVHRMFFSTTFRLGNCLALSVYASPPDRPAELLASQRAKSLLKMVEKELKPHLILVNVPPISMFDDGLAVLPYCQNAMLVATADVTTAEQADRAERLASAYGDTFGVILNQCRFS